MKTKSGNNEPTLIELSFYFRLWTLPRKCFWILCDNALDACYWVGFGWETIPWRNEEQETVNVRMIKKTNIKCNLSISICCSIVCQIYLLKLGYFLLEVTKVLIALRHVYIRRANFTAKSRFEIVKLRSFTWMNSQGSRVEKNHDSRSKSTNANNFGFKRGWVVSMHVYRNHAQEP